MSVNWKLMSIFIEGELGKSAREKFEREVPRTFSDDELCVYLYSTLMNGHTDGAMLYESDNSDFIFNAMANNGVFVEFLVNRQSEYEFVSDSRVLQITDNLRLHERIGVQAATIMYNDEIEKNGSVHRDSNTYRDLIKSKKRYNVIKEAVSWDA